MNKAELIDKVATTAGVAKGEAERTLGAFFEHVLNSAKRGDRIGWPGFGTFSATRRKARTGRNPQTGAAVKIPATTAMKFTASATLKTNLNSKKAASKAPATKTAAATKKAASPAKQAAAPAKTAAKQAAGAAKKATTSAKKTAASTASKASKATAKKSSR